MIDQGVSINGPKAPDSWPRRYGAALFVDETPFRQQVANDLVGI
jgi:hypothetical protein